MRFLRWLRQLETTSVFGPARRLSLHDIGVQWGEGEWTSRDLWDRRP